MNKPVVHLKYSELIDCNGMVMVSYPCCLSLEEYNELDEDLPMTDDIEQVTCRECFG